MKTIYKILLPFIFLLTFGLTGCYTVMWSPEAQMPESQDTQGSYYDNPYYGEYHYYYDSPWWYSTMPHSYYNDQSAYNRDTSRGMTNLRNDNGRGGGTTTRLPEPPRTISGTTESAIPSGSSSSNRTESTNNRNSSGNSGTSRGSTSNSGNRNSNNDRNSNGRN